MKILLTAIGKRVQLIKHLKKSNYVVGVDSGDIAPAMHFVDSFHKVPKCYEENFIDILFNICVQEKIDMLIPLYEKEFIRLCDNRKKFEDRGVTLLLSDKKIIETANDKIKTYNFFRDNKINTPLSFAKKNIILALNEKIVGYPLIIKPKFGMGSQGVFKINNENELMFFLSYIEEPIIQEFIRGIEYTIDVLCGLNGEIISVVPRERLEVRAGEVSKARTVKHQGIIDETITLISKLNNSKLGIKAIGPLNIQCIATTTNEIKFIEINPRFGGGVPLTFEAGIDYGKILNKMMYGETIQPIIGEFKETTMLRYDEAIFI